MENIKTKIKDKLPDDYHFVSQPLFYCEEDDTLFTSRQDASYHMHKCLVNKAVKNLSNLEKSIGEQLFRIQIFKTSVLPRLQKELDSVNSKIKELKSKKDWRETHKTNGEKKNDILMLKFKRMTIIKELNNKISEFYVLKRSYKDLVECIPTAKKRIEEEKKSASDAIEYWKSHNDVSMREALEWCKNVLLGVRDVTDDHDIRVAVMNVLEEYVDPALS